MGAVGTTTIDFLSGSSRLEMATVTIADTNILSTSAAEAWIQGTDSTTDNDIDAHILASEFFISVNISNINQGTGFTIKGIAIGRWVTKTFKVKWVWS